MSYIQLRRRVRANPDPRPGAAPFLAQVEYFNTEARNVYATQLDSQANDPTELALNALVYTFEYRPGKSREVRYAGNGTVKTVNIAAGTGAPPATSTLQAFVQPTTTYTSGPAATITDGSIDATGSMGAPPYQLRLSGPVTQNGSSPSSSYIWRFRNLPPGTYTLTVTDAQGSQASVPNLQVYAPAAEGLPRFAGLSYDYDGDDQAGSGSRTVWLLNDRTVFTQSLNGGGSQEHSAVAANSIVDQYLLDDGVTLRKVKATATTPVDVYFEDVPTAAVTTGTLTLDNLILFNPDTAAEQNGGAVVEVLATALPLSFALKKGTQTLQTNTTGYFDGLSAGEYTCTVTDNASNSLDVPFTLTLDYAPRWQLVFDDLDGVPLRLELWLKGYAGDVEDICGQAEPVTLQSDGLNSSLGGQGDLPSVVGTSAELALLVPPDTFLEVELGRDRDCRCDVYRDGQLEFRGYVQPDVYEGPLLDGLQAYTLTATDGLAGLKDAYMTGHIGQRLTGHRPWLNTVLHCLSRTGVALPLRCFVNRRDATMADADAPELAATSNRTGYWDDSDKNEPIFQRTVLDALCQALGGTLCQRGGAWEVRSPLETALAAAGRRYKPAGTAIDTVTAASPTATVVPPSLGAPFWVDAAQVKQVRAGWKSLVGSTDAGYLPNAYVAGKVFSDKYSWLEDFNALRPINGWAPAPSTTFPLVLVRSSEKGTDYTTEWPRSTASNAADARYLQGPPLPLASGGEAIPAQLFFTAQLLPVEYYADYLTQQPIASPTTARKAILPYEILVDGVSTGLQTAELPADGKANTVTIPLTVLPSGANQAVLRVYAWYAPDNSYLAGLAPVFVFMQAYTKGDVVRYDPSGGTSYRLFVARRTYAAGVSTTPLSTTEWAEILATDAGRGQLLVSEVGVKLLPQGVTWDGKDNFRADGPGGTVRPSEVLEVYHPDVPLAAGLYGGNLFAFGKGVGLSDGTMSTAWARPADLLPSPLFEANVLDAEALRANPSRLAKGELRHQAVAPLHLLDSVDLPYDISGRRFYVGQWEWPMKAALQKVSLVENGVGATAPDPADTVPDGARITHRLIAYLPGRYTPQVRRTHSGRIRVRHL